MKKELYNFVGEEHFNKMTITDESIKVVNSYLGQEDVTGKYTFKENDLSNMLDVISKLDDGEVSCVQLLPESPAKAVRVGDIVVILFPVDEDGIKGVATFHLDAGDFADLCKG